ncbi:MAG: 1-acyl-sn-glycerol-3-phosphate acyltransferase [Bacteroidales bacterium]
MRSLILNVFDFFKRNRAWFWLSMLSAFVLLSFLALRVSFEEDISRILQMDSKTLEYRKILQNIRAVDKLTICISDKSFEKTSTQLKMAFCDSLLTKIKTLDSSLVRKVIASPDDFPFMEVYKALLRNLPFFMQEQDYTRLDSLLKPDQIKHHLEMNERLLGSPAGMMARQGLPWDPAGIALPVTNRLQELGEASGYELNNGYFFTRDKNHLLVFIDPANAANETGKNAVLIKSLERFAGEIGKQNGFDRLECTFVGATAISVENARQIQHDTLLTLGIMCVALFLLITSVFRRKRTPILIFLPTVFGMIFALACISFIKPDISLIAIGATSILLGIAVNYPLHILTHRLHEPDLRKVIGDMVEPMTIGSATTIGGFLCLLFVKAEILYDFGLLGAFGLVGAVFFSLVFLPHLIGEQVTEGKLAEKWLNRAGEVQLENNSYLPWIIILLTPVFFYFAGDIEFDSNLMHLNYTTPAQKKTEQILRGDDSLMHSVYVISYGQTLDQALVSAGIVKKLSDSLNRAGAKNSYSGIADFFPSELEQKQRLARWKHYFTPEKIEALTTALDHAAKESGFREGAFDNFRSLLEVKSGKIDSADNTILFNALAKDVVTTSIEMSTIITIVKVPVAGQKRIDAVLSAQKNTRLLDNNFLSAQLSSIISDDFNFIAIFSALMVFIALLLTYGKLELAITAFVPMVVSWVWILGLMGLFHVKFNIVNIILSTFIFGLGDDYCIFTMDGLLQEYRGKKRPMPVIRMSILLSGLTTLIGFGVLLVAKHPALQSIALVSVIGILSVLLISQVLEPYLFRTFVTKPVSRGFPPTGIGTFIQSVFAYTYFISGCIFLSISGFFLVVINPFYRKKSQKILNALISKVAWLQLYIITSVTKRVIFDEKPDYSRPAVYVANHQSVLDILSMVMLSPKIILLTNQWVWNSPLFGYVVRLAGYYPIFEGADPGIETLRQKVSEGYSIAIFPEGTRSRDGKIGRFHKGAFYLAQKLELDLIPVLFHDTRKCIAKGSFVVRTSTFTIKVLQRIKFISPEEGSSYQQKAKEVCQLLRRENALLDEEMRTPGQCRRRVIENYLFKGPVLEWYMKVKMRMEGNYALFNDLVPKEGVIVDAGCGYGFMAYMLAYLSPNRNITGFDYDEAKVEVALSGFDKPANLRFAAASLQNFPITTADCVIFSDVLHYLEEAERNSIFTAYAEKLNPGGILIVRDGDKEPGKKHGTTKLTEFLSTRIFRFNKKEKELSFFSASDLVYLGQSLGFEAQIIDHQKWNSNVVIVFRKVNNG